MEERGRKIKFFRPEREKGKMNQGVFRHRIAAAACWLFGHRWSDASDGWFCDRCRSWNVDRMGRELADRLQDEG